MAEGARRSSRFSMRSKQLGQLLVENGDLTSEQVNDALATQEAQGGLIGSVLRQAGLVDENQIAAGLLKQVQVTDVRCEDLQVPYDVIDLVPRETCDAEKLCPFERLGNLLCLVMGNPLNRRAITQIEERNGVKVKSFKAPWPKISELIERSYSQAAPEGGGDAAPEGEQAGGDDLSIPTLDLPEGEAAPAAEGEGDVAVEAAAEAAPGPVLRKPRQPEKAEAKIHGIDSLDESQAEVIQVNRRGLTQKIQKPFQPPTQKVPRDRKAKVNVDLDALDLSSGEVVRERHDMDDESYEEIEVVAVKPASQRGDEGFVNLKLIEDKYFYADNAAPKGGRSDELLDLLEDLPVAVVVAESIGDYDAKQRAEKPSEQKPVKAGLSAAAAVAVKSGKSEQAAPAVKKPLELEAAPASVMTAILISEADFQKQTVGQGEDPVGEWDWNFITAGPVIVQVYDEN